MAEAASERAMTVATLRARPLGSRTVRMTAVLMLGGLSFNLVRMRLRLDAGPLWLSMVAFGLLGLAALACAAALGRSRDDLGLKRPLRTPFLLGSALGAAVMVTMAAVTAPVTRVPGAQQLLGGIALFALCTGPAEELLFRGLLYGVVAEEHGPVTATAVTAVAFALIHVPAYGFASLPVATCAGLLFGWLRWWCRSLAGPWLVHSIADLSLLWL
jgi:membrane protease YdiL (CAAX protease family)